MRQTQPRTSGYLDKPCCFLKRACFILLIGLCGLTAAFAATENELLPPDQAYQLNAYAVDVDMIHVEWRIADGYYLYRKKFKFTSDTPGIRFGEADFPEGGFIEDEFFGKSEIYRNKVIIGLPLIFDAKDTLPAALKITTVSQGCADIGVCYPPHTQTASFDLITQDNKPAKQGGILSSIASLGQRFGINRQDQAFLPPEQAFIFSADVRDANTVIARWEIADGYYLYRDKFKFKLLDGDGVTLGKFNAPPGKLKHDETFGETEVYYDHIELTLPLQHNNTMPTRVTLEVHHQGCADAGFCYPPAKQNTSLILPVAGASPGLNNTVSLDDLPEQDRIARWLAGDRSLLAVLLFLFGAGVILAFTPCVLPMLPILSSIIVGQGDKVTTRTAFSLSLIYVLAMALTYTVAGVIAGLLGKNLQIMFQNPWVLASFSGLFVLLALSMFGFYELQLPGKWQSKLSELSNTQRGGTYIGAGIMGFFSALIVGPCVAAPLAGVLIYIGLSGDGLLGGLSLFALSMGMGFPLLVFGTSAGKLLPKAGPWMHGIKTVFGIILLGLAIWLLERIIPEGLSMLLWAALLILSAICLGALKKPGAAATAWATLRRASGLVILIYGAVLIVGAASGGKDVFRPLQALNFSGNNEQNSSVAHGLPFKAFKGLDGLQSELRLASAANKMVMLDFYADWCVECKKMEKRTFSDPRVQQALANAVLLQADVTANDEADQALLKHFGLFGPPAILFFDLAGNELDRFRLIGFFEPGMFSKHAEKAFSQ